jgi:hypothetical protein
LLTFAVSLLLALPATAILAQSSPGAGAPLVSLAPISASLQQILMSAPSYWQTTSFGLYRWDRFPDVLIFDTASYGFQDRMFSRIAFYLEKRGFRGKLLTDGQLDGKHGWNAHDYGPEGLASFFNAAAASKLTLNHEEKTLLQIALSDGVLSRGSAGFRAGTGAVLSISRSSDAIQRRLLLAHESFHGIFFASEAYRSYCMRLWDAIDSSQRDFFQALLSAIGYDGDDSYLVVNEFQAYLMQQPLSATVQYFSRVSSLVPAAVASGGDPKALLSVAEELSRFTLTHFGIEAGGTLLHSVQTQ